MELKYLYFVESLNFVLYLAVLALWCNLTVHFDLYIFYLNISVKKKKNPWEI